MGLFTTVTAIFPCARCGRSYPADVQFKTSEEDELLFLAEHERAEALLPGAYEGIAGAYCAACVAQGRVHEDLQCFERLVVVSDERRVRVVRAN